MGGGNIKMEKKILQFPGGERRVGPEKARKLNSEKLAELRDADSDAVGSMNMEERIGLHQGSKDPYNSEIEALTDEALVQVVNDFQKEKIRGRTQYYHRIITELKNRRFIEESS